MFEAWISFGVATIAGWQVWSGFVDGRVIKPIGPRRQTEPVWYWVAQVVMALTAVIAFLRGFITA